MKRKIPVENKYIGKGRRYMKKYEEFQNLEGSVK